jgi:putative spermidine/putrescine transport system ATP-binding protein
MNGGKIEQVGTPGEIYDHPASEFVASFIGDTNLIRRDGVTIAVRAERMQVARERTGPGTWLDGEVIAAMVVGAAVQLVVRANDGQNLLIRQQRAGGQAEAESLSEGERVVVGWTDDAALVLAGPEKGDHT